MNSKNNNVTISASKNLIQNCYDQIWNLQKLTANTKSENSAGGLEVLQEIVSKKYEIEEKLNEIKRHLPTLKKSINKRRKKREKRRAKINESFENNQKRRNEIHLKIDQNLKEIHNKWTDEKNKSDLEKEKQLEINTINAMIKESSKQLALIANLSMLRQQRKSTVSFEISDDDDKEFHKKSTEVSVIWKNHIEVLQHRLNILLDRRDVNNEQSKIEKNERLFGDPTFNANPLTQMSIDSLVSIRRKWDAFITSKEDTEGSYIPKNWVESSMSFDEFFDKN